MPTMPLQDLREPYINPCKQKLILHQREFREAMYAFSSYVLEKLNKQLFHFYNHIERHIDKGDRIQSCFKPNDAVKGTASAYYA